LTKWRIFAFGDVKHSVFTFLHHRLNFIAASPLFEGKLPSVFYLWFSRRVLVPPNRGQPFFFSRKDPLFDWLVVGFPPPATPPLGCAFLRSQGTISLISNVLWMPVCFHFSCMTFWCFPLPSENVKWIFIRDLPFSPSFPRRAGPFHSPNCFPRRFRFLGPWPAWRNTRIFFSMPAKLSFLVLSKNFPLDSA